MTRLATLSGRLGPLVFAVLAACGGQASDAPRDGEREAGADQQSRIRRELEALGYAVSAEPAPEQQGVTTYDARASAPGLNLYTSGHRSAAYLIDADGTELHSWSYAFKDVWPTRKRRPRDRSWRVWRYVHPLDNGDLLAVFENLGLIRLDRDSELLWASTVPTHHDLDILPNGDILALSGTRRMVPRLDPTRRIWVDSIARLSPEGRILESFSLLDVWERSEFESEEMAALPFRERTRFKADVFHANTLEVLDGSLSHLSPLYARGNILTSFRNIDTIAILDPKSRKLVWSMTGDWGGQHYPTLLDDGTILLFINNALGKASRVEIIDPTTGTTTWTYRGAPPESFYSRFCGAAQMLPNGNVLITESQAGRALEVNGNGEIVWEFFCPYRIERKERSEIAYLYLLSRFPLERFADWLPR